MKIELIEEVKYDDDIYDFHLHNVTINPAI